jgi:SAM-dependent methyltransferase
MKIQDVVEGRIYDDLAYLIPLLSPPQQYAEGAAHWKKILREKLGPGRHTILELGVGGGSNLSHLTTDFQATAVDLSEKMLAVCRQLNPGVELHQGDMRTVRLGRKFSAVLIHDAISYMQTEADLRAVFATAAAHLNPGGVLITSLDNYQENFQNPQVDHFTHTYEDMRLTYLGYTYQPDPNDTKIISLILYLIHRQTDLQIEFDQHRLGLFHHQDWIDWMNEAGYQVEERALSMGAEGQSQSLLVGVLKLEHDFISP